LFQQAQALYAVGKYDEAALEFEDAFLSKPDPALLFNAAQSYRLAGNKSKALLLYRNYAKLYPSAPERDAVQKQIKVLEGTGSAGAALGAPPAPAAPVATTEEKAAPIASAAPQTPREGAPRMPSLAVSTSPPAPPPTITAVPVADHDHHHDERTSGRVPIYRRPWVWVAAAAIVAAGAFGIAIIATGDTYPTASLTSRRY